MSLFKAFANYCRKSNERAMRRNDARRKAKRAAASQAPAQRTLKDDEIHCCYNCSYYYNGACNRYQISDHKPIISDPYNTTCEEFYFKTVYQRWNYK